MQSVGCVCLCVGHTDQGAFGGQTLVGQKNHVLDGSVHLRHLANTLERFVCSGAAALCEITLNTCLLLVLLAVSLPSCTCITTNEPYEN